jgi:putative methyltransferase
MSSSPYAPAARLLGSIWETKKSLKTLAYDKKGNLTISKSTYAQVCHVLEAKKQLDVVVQDAKITCRNEGLLYVLLYELLLGPNKKIRGGGALKRQLMEQEETLRAVMDRQLQQQQQQQPTRHVIAFPRYVRVNTLRTTLPDVVAYLKQRKTSMYLDPHVPNLLVLPPKTDMHELVASGHVVLQDKSSCFSALCLAAAAVNNGGDCLDACAAPGNKTSHLCMLMPHRNITACDRNQQRLNMMVRRLQPLLKDERQVDAKLMDFLTTVPKDFNKVRGILLDPSCSGSGIFTSPDRTHDASIIHPNDNDDDDEDMKQRIQSLSNFQVTALKHAMSFPNVNHIVYSTCSLHEQENEHVVSQALESNKDSWELVPPLPLAHWKRRGHTCDGLLTEQQAACLIRADMEDETNGFFVACFERVGTNKQKSSTNDTAASMPTIQEVEGLEWYNGQFLSAPVIDTEPRDITFTMTKPSKPKNVPIKAKVPSKQTPSPKEAAAAAGPSSSKQKPSTMKKETTSAAAAAAPKKSSSLTKNDKPKPKSTLDGNNNNNNNKITTVKKAAKKQAWKLKQKENKKTRLLKQESNNKKI